ncbi:hypothetical protein QRD89_08650 [Halobacillus sp. ACCC02827]|uniref:hypothetical protein n=1 Tax=Bacillaceae TaxID=186817 RepID=UPI001F1C2E2A|nr:MULTISPECIES: hypothetical protein [Bacillaceae]WJE17663.1 hypothetical protein QRD89_08650 [Halobacillus sp. ACCC02827]
MTVKSNKHSCFILMNAALGILTCFIYLYSWVALTFLESMPVLEPVFSLTLSMLVFFLWNFVMLKRERKRYWAQAVFSYFGSVAFFAYFLT